MKALGFVILAVLSVWGAAGIRTTLAEGHAVLATTQHVPWGLWVAGYIFFLGLSAGSFLLSTLVYVFGVKRLEPAGPLALLQAFGCLVLGGFLIVIDLGHPARMLGLILSPNPTSVMAWMGFFYNLYIAIVLVELYLAVRMRLVARAAAGSRISRLLSLGSMRMDSASVERDRTWLKRLGILGIPVAVIVHGGVGTIFAVAKARPSWFGGLLPIVFLVSALASGGALLTFLVAFFSREAPARRLPVVQFLAKLSIGILCFDLLLLASEILTTFYGGVPHESSAWRLALGGPHWWVFWFLQIGGGLVVPVLLVSNRRSGAAALGVAGLLIVIGIFGARLNLVIPTQITPQFESLPEAYHHARWQMGYTPSVVEWQVLWGTVAIGAWMYLLARKVLPLEETA